MKIDILVYPGCDELDVIGPYEVLSSARKSGADFIVRLVSLYDEKMNCASHGLRFETHNKFKAGEQDILIVPGGSWAAKGELGAWAEYKRGSIIEKLREAHIAFPKTIFVSVCTGSMILAHAGIIGSRRATTHHSAWESLAALGVEVVRERVVVADAYLITAGGITSGIDLGIYLIHKFAGEHIAQTITELMEYTPSFPKD